jgi:hypothetical protein
MKQRAPMNRGKGFMRSTREAAESFEISRIRNFQGSSAPADAEAACGLPADRTPVHHQVRADVRRGTYAQPALETRPVPKPEAHRNRHLLDMARGKPCLVRIAGICSFDTDTTIAAHSNSSFHGKAGARKANDEFSVWCCFHCHSWLDQGRASADKKEMAFMVAHLAQVCEWRAITGSTASDPKDRAAAQWALDHLNATPVGLGDIT